MKQSFRTPHCHPRVQFFATGTFREGRDPPLCQVLRCAEIPFAGRSVTTVVAGLGLRSSGSPLKFGGGRTGERRREGAVRVQLAEACNIRTCSLQLTSAKEAWETQTLSTGLAFVHTTSLYRFRESARSTSGNTSSVREA